MPWLKEGGKGRKPQVVQKPRPVPPSVLPNLRRAGPPTICTKIVYGACLAGKACRT
jgi:hypothetical protein